MLRPTDRPGRREVSHPIRVGKGSILALDGHFHYKTEKPEHDISMLSVLTGVEHNVTQVMNSIR